MTWAMIGASAVMAVGSVVGQATAKKPGGPAPQAQVDENQKSAPLQPTASQQMTPPALAQPQGAATVDPNQVKALVMPTIPTEAPLGDYLKRRQQGY